MSELGWREEAWVTEVLHLLFSLGAHCPWTVGLAPAPLGGVTPLPVGSSPRVPCSFVSLPSPGVPYKKPNMHADASQVFLKNFLNKGVNLVCVC